MTLVVLAVAAGLASWALQQAWVSAQVRDGDLPVQVVNLTGASSYPVSVAAAWVALAAVAAIIATRGKVRAAVGVLVLVCAAGIGVAAIAFSLSSHIESVAANYQTNPDITATVTSDWVVVALAAVLVAGCGVATLVFGSSWPALSTRQDGAKAKQASAWDALDRGDDPTAAV